MESRDLLTVSEVAERSGFAPSAIRFYDKEGLISSSRTGGGQRRFERNMLRRLAFIRAARNVGLTPRRDRRCAVDVAGQSHADPRRLDQAVEGLAATPRRSDRRADGVA